MKLKKIFLALLLSIACHSILFLKCSDDKNTSSNSRVLIKFKKLKGLNNNISKLTSPSDLNKNSKRVSKDTDVINSTRNTENFNEYLNLLASYIQNKIEYPHKAKRLKQEDDIVIEIVIYKNGRLKDFSITQASRFSDLNNFVNNLLEHMESVPKPPKYLFTSDSIKINIPIDFKL